MIAAEYSGCGKVFVNCTGYKAISNLEAPPQMAFAEGDLLDGRYEFLRSLGQGGFAEVFLAQDIVLGRQVAIKFPHFVVNKDAEGHARFQREATILGQLRHKNVVSVYAHGRADDGTPYLVMEYVDGRPLSRLIEEGALTYDLLNSIVSQVCDGLEHASQFGVVHRDLSPSNICVCFGTIGIEAKVIDFGLSRVFGFESSAGKLTQEMVAVGCPPYMSPELARGEDVDVRSDIYSLGCVLYECVSSNRAFESLSPARLLEMHQLEMPNPPELLPPFKSHTDLSPLILKCLQKDRQERYQSPIEVKAALTAPKKSVKSVNVWSARIVTQKSIYGMKRAAMLTLCILFLGAAMFAGLNDQFSLSARSQMYQHSVAADLALRQQNFSRALHEQVEAASFAHAAHDIGKTREHLSNALDVYTKHPKIVVAPEDIRSLSILGDDVSRSVSYFNEDVITQSLLLEMAVTTNNPGEVDLPLMSLKKLLNKYKIPNDGALDRLYSALFMYLSRPGVQPSKYAKTFAEASFVLVYGNEVEKSAQLAVLFCEKSVGGRNESQLARLCGHPLGKAALIKDASLLRRLVVQQAATLSRSDMSPLDRGVSYLLLCIGTLQLGDEKSCSIYTEKALKELDFSIDNGLQKADKVHENMELYWTALSAARNQPALVSAVVQVILNHRGASIGDGALRAKFVALEKRVAGNDF